MQTAVGLMTILAAALVATECRSPLEPRPPPVDFCRAIVHYCTSPFQENAFIAGESTDYRLLLEDVDGLCETYEHAANCITPSLHNCQGRNQQIPTLFAVGGFLCSDEGKSLLAQYRESPCYNNQTIIFQLDDFVRNCQRELNIDPRRQRQCQVMRDVYACAGNALTWSCGEAAGRIFNGIADRVMPTRVSDCFEPTLVDNLVKRGLDIFERRK